MIWKGVLLALGAAVVHTTIDALRKTGSSTLSVTSLVCLVNLLDACISCSFVAATGGFRHVTFQDPKVFCAAVVGSATLLLLCKFLYQHAITVSQLSLTVPYLSFTPTFLVATAYLFVDEEPTFLGLVGIGVVTAGGYLLSRQDQHALGSGSSSSPQSGLPITRPGGIRRSNSRDNAGGSRIVSWLGVDPSSGSSGRPYGEAGMSGADGREGQHSTEMAEMLLPKGSSRSLQELELADPALGVGSSLSNGKVLAARPGRSGVLTPDTDELDRMAAGLLSTQLASVGVAGYVGPGGLGVTPKVHAAAGKWTGALKGWDSGTAIMTCVAAMWAVSASLDKLGVLHAPTVWVYFAAQRAVIGVASCIYQLVHAPHAFKLLLSRNIRLLLVISILEVLSVVLFLEAIQYLFVSYVVAIKRSNILMSVVLGGLVWREKVIHRLPYICLMLLGMTLIVLDPDSSTVHTSSHS